MVHHQKLLLEFNEVEKPAFCSEIIHFSIIENLLTIKFSIILVNRYERMSEKASIMYWWTALTLFWIGILIENPAIFVITSSNYYV